MLSRVGRSAPQFFGRACKISIAGSLGFLMLALGGCVPHPPDSPAPFSLSLSKQGLAMTLCFGPGEITNFTVDVRENTADGWSDWLPLAETADDVLIPFNFEDSLPLQVEIQSVSYRVLRGTSLSGGKSSVAVYFHVQFESGRTAYYNASFFVESERQLAGGGYLSSDGTVHTGACEMDSARR